MILRRVFRKKVISHTWGSCTEMDCKKLGMLVLFLRRIVWSAVHLCFLPMRVVMSIDHDMCLSFVRLMAGHGRSFTAVDWCIAMMCHNVKYWQGVAIVAFGLGCLGVDNSSVQSGVNDISAFSWESVGVVLVWTINSSFGWAENWQGVAVSVGGEWANWESCVGMLVLHN